MMLYFLPSEGIKGVLYIYFVKVQSCKPQGQRISAEYRGGGSFPESSAGLGLSHVNFHLDYNIFQLFSLLEVDCTEKHHPRGTSYLKCANASG